MAGQAGRDVEDGLRKVFTEIASLQLLPDAPAHAQFLSMVQQAIQKYLTVTAQQKQEQMGQQAQALAGGQPPSGGGGPLPPPPGPAQFGPGGASGGGSPGNVQMPNPDELRRVLAGSSGAAA